MMFTQKRFSVFWSLILLIGLSCTKDDPQPDMPQKTDSGVIVLNEGPFGTPNASLSLYDPVSKLVTNEVYKSANGEVLGEILQSAYLLDGELYAILNVSGKLEVIDTFDFSSKQQITDLTNARYMAVTDTKTAYITTIFGSSVYKVSLSNGIILDTLSVPAWTEDILYQNNEIILTDRSGSSLLLIDPGTDLVTDTISVGRGPSDMLLDKQGQLWVYCAGDAWSMPPVAASIYRVDLTTRSAQRIHQFDDIENNGNRAQLAINGTKDTIYLTRKDIFRFATDNPRALDNFFSREGSTFYGLGVDPLSSQVYVGDGVDFVQNGLVYRISPQKQLIDSFAVGVLPNGFLFK